MHKEKSIEPLKFYKRREKRVLRDVDLARIKEVRRQSPCTVICARMQIEGQIENTKDAMDMMVDMMIRVGGKCVEMYARVELN